MIEISQALALIQQSAKPLGTTLVPLLQATDRVLAKDIVSPIDSPPFDKSMMDGFAIRYEDIDSGDNLLRIVDRVQAGATPSMDVEPGTAIQIMTGAPMPNGATAVVMVEHTTEIESDMGPQVLIKEDTCKPDQNILRRATAMSVGETIMQRGHRILSKDIGVLAEIGETEISVNRLPSVSIVATGDELVPFDIQPTEGQIRNSNGPMLEVLASELGLSVQNLGIAVDQKEVIQEKIQKGLRDDLLLLSGGVSAGVADLVPSVLQELGVQQVFHKVSIKPGKPLWYGTRDDGEHTTHVFGLPGNPVSSLVCFHIFVREAIGVLAGHRQAERIVSCKLTRDHRQRGGRTTFWPSVYECTDEVGTIEPLNWKGSADLCTLASANAFAIFPGDQDQFEAGSEVEALLL